MLIICYLAYYFIHLPVSSIHFVGRRQLNCVKEWASRQCITTVTSEILLSQKKLYYVGDPSAQSQL